MNSSKKASITMLDIGSEIRQPPIFLVPPSTSHTNSIKNNIEKILPQFLNIKPLDMLTQGYIYPPLPAPYEYVENNHLKSDDDKFYHIEIIMPKLLTKFIPDSIPVPSQKNIPLISPTLLPLEKSLPLVKQSRAPGPHLSIVHKAPGPYYLKNRYNHGLFVDNKFQLPNFNHVPQVNSDK